MAQTGLLPAGLVHLVLEVAPGPGKQRVLDGATEPVLAAVGRDELCEANM